MKTSRELTVLGDAPADPALDARLEALEAQAERDLSSGNVGFNVKKSAHLLGSISAVLFARDARSLAAFYAEVGGFTGRPTDDDDILLQSDAAELRMVQIPERWREDAGREQPLGRRERAAVKLVFFVPDIASCRAAAARLGGSVEAREREYQFEAWTVCDGVDPEGNVFQVRTRR